ALCASLIAVRPTVYRAIVGAQRAARRAQPRTTIYAPTDQQPMPLSVFRFLSLFTPLTWMRDVRRRSRNIRSEETIKLKPSASVQPTIACHRIAFVTHISQPRRFISTRNDNPTSYYLDNSAAEFKDVPPLLSEQIISTGTSLAVMLLSS
ncbi:hypothetical protein Tcan_00605, partial [Toxocara canis]